MTEEQLSALLRLKRYEQPPPGYFDQLLRDVHQRQRDELLKQPLWKIALERMQTFFGEHSMSPASYAGAMATVLIMGFSVISLVSPGHRGSQATAAPVLADRAPVQPLTGFSLQASATGEHSRNLLDLPPVRSVAQPGKSVHQPRYVIDARPVSYEPSFSF